MRIILNVLFATSCFSLFANDRANNGGGISKERYIEVGRLFQADLADALVALYGVGAESIWRYPVDGIAVLNFDLFDLALHRGNIKFSEGPLFDRFDSKVTARAEDPSPLAHPLADKIMMIEVDESSINIHFDRDKEIRRNICHEMVRAIKINDDNYSVCDFLLEDIAKLAKIRTYHAGYYKRFGITPKITPPLSRSSTLIVIESHKNWLKYEFDRKFWPKIETSDDENDEINGIEKLKSKQLDKDLKNYQIYNNYINDFDDFRNGPHAKIKVAIDELSIYVPRFVELERPENFQNKSVVRYQINKNQRTSGDLTETESSRINQQMATIYHLLDLSNSSDLAISFRRLISELGIEQISVNFEVYSPDELSRLDGIDLSEEDATIVRKLPKGSYLRLQSLRKGPSEIGPGRIEIILPTTKKFDVEIFTEKEIVGRIAGLYNRVIGN